MKSISSKAISPMIATVLLIAFTVAVGGILSLWMTGLTTTTTSSVENTTTDQVKCASTWINVISVTSNGVIITNGGAQTITNVFCYTGTGTNVTNVATPSLVPGGISAGNWTIGTNTSIICSGKCLTIGVTGECKSGQTCWK